MGCCDNIVTDTIVAPNEIFQNIKEIGEGNNANVFLIQSKKTQKEYALKVIKIKNLKESILDIIKREVYNLKKLNHPNIISFKCAFESNIKTPLLNIITEYADNGDLEQKLKINHKEEKYFEENELLDWFIQICLALKYIHGMKIIHRDIKPSNIFLMKNNTIKIGDFGLSKNISIFGKTRTIIGTPLYMAPEITDKKFHSFEADIWSLGVTFCHLMSLEFPFEGRDPEDIYKNISQKKLNRKILNKEQTYYKQEILDKYSKEFLDLIDELMSLDPEKRPSAEQILEKKIISERMNLCLKENNFDYTKAENSIQDYEKKQNDENLIDNFDDKNNNIKNNFIIIEKINDKDIDKLDNNKLVRTMDNTHKKEKVNYDFLRQLTFIHKSLFKKEEKKNINIKNFLFL